jgi:hypothetical protein
MQVSRALRYAAAATALGAISLLALGNAATEADGQTNLIRDGQAGFIVHGFGNALARPGQIEAMCPDGRSLGYRQIFEHSPEGRRRADESADQHEARLNAGAFSLATLDGQSLCANPELGPPDPHYRMMTATGIAAFGIDLDGQVSTRAGRPAPGTCAHDDFIGVDGRAGVDNQMARVVGCDGAGEQYAAQDQSGALPRGENGVSETMLQGGWGIVIALRGVDNLRNDDHVEVGIYASADPIQLNPARDAAVPHMTYAADQDPRFRAETTGRIRNGVLTTEPVNVRFHWLPAGLRAERPLHHARLQVAFTADGGMEGYLAGYTPVEDMYNINYGFRNARNDAGQIVPPSRTAALNVLGNSVMGRTCHGAYQAMYALADGDPDPETGRCTSISTQYWLRATPAFVVDAQTRSLNDDLTPR